MSKYIWWFNELDKDSLQVAGGKGANLGQMAHLGFPVPPGFAVSVSAYYSAIKSNGLEAKIKELLEDIKDDLEDSDKLDAASSAIKSLISQAPVPADISDQISRAYEELCNEADQSGVLVAIRSSATAEDLPSASFAGQQSTYLNIKGAQGVIEAVRDCWASLFESRAIYYRSKHDFDHMRVGLCAVVQQMIQSVSSGVMFTADPINGRLDRVVIEAGWGLGEAVVSGLISPDMYLLSKAADPLKILNKTIAKQTVAIIRTDSGETLETLVPKDKQSVQKLDDQNIMELGSIGCAIEKAYGGQPQDIEWALDSHGKLFIVQTRNITTLNQAHDVKEDEEIGAAPILKGLPASPGIAHGHVRLIKDRRDLAKVQPGDIIVAHMTSPDYVPVMKRSGAIVTDAGGMTCHAAIVARELGIPCVVGTGSATDVLKPNTLITVDAHTGLVYAGKVSLGRKEESGGKTVTGSSAEAVSSVQAAPITATKLLVNIADPDVAERVAKDPTLCDGVGLIRAEFMISALGTHPNQLAKEGHASLFIEALATSLARIAKAFSPRPVIYRANDFKSNEYRGLPGGDHFEPHEENPMIGYRGCLRYMTDPTVFEMELAAISKVNQDHGLSNIKLMIPFVRTVPEFKQVLAMCPANLEVGMMCEVPSNVLLCGEFCRAGAKFMSIGSNDLAQLILGADRDSALLSRDFDERDPAVLKAIRKVIKTCHKHGVGVSICGQMPSVYPETIQILVDAGIDGISVNPDVLEGTRRLVASAEQKFIINHIRK